MYVYLFDDTKEGRSAVGKKDIWSSRAEQAG